jgi:hypothetical protein
MVLNTIIGYLGLFIVIGGSIILIGLLLMVIIMSVKSLINNHKGIKKNGNI